MSQSGVRLKIAYVVVCFNAQHSGVFKKIYDQVSLWKSLGHSVQLFVITDRESQTRWQRIDESCVTLIDNTLKMKIVNRFKLISLAAETSASVIYLRDSFPLRISKTKTPIVIEIQSLVGQELRIRSKLRYVVFSLLKKLHYRYLSGAIFVTDELMRLNEFRLHPNLPKIAIGNSIDLKRFPTLPRQSDRKLALLFVGTPNQAWHGISELVDFAKLNPDIQVEIVGASEEQTAHNLNFHGFLSPKDYWDIAATCIAGVGPLNLSVKKMTEASSLKVREYLALGLPVILKGKDTDLDSQADFVLQLPCDGRQFADFSVEIRSFLNEWAHKRVERLQVRHLDATIKEEIRLGFLENVVSQQVHDRL